VMGDDLPMPKSEARWPKCATFAGEYRARFWEPQQCAPCRVCHAPLVPIGHSIVTDGLHEP
jgi:hypothetical protein